jgi:hypothetical protein
VKESLLRGGVLDGIGFETVVSVGDIWVEVESVIRQRNIDLLVLGTHSRTGIAKLALGSIAERIFRNTSCPVLTGRPLLAGRNASGFEYRTPNLVSDRLRRKISWPTSICTLAGQTTSRTTGGVSRAIPNVQDEEHSLAKSRRGFATRDEGRLHRSSQGPDTSFLPGTRTALCCGFRRAPRVDLARC